MGKWTIGVDVGGTEIKFGLFDEVCRENWSIPTNISDNGSHILPEIAASVLGKCKDLGIAPESLNGIGIGVPGPVLNENTVQVCVNLGWLNVNVGDELSAMLHVPVRVANDANLAALGEMWLGSGKDYRSLVMATLGTGVGGGIILDGKIVNGFMGFAGEIGHIPCVDDEDLDGDCSCGNRGCLEQISSASGIASYAKKMLTESNEPSVLREKFSTSGDITAKDVMDAAKAGDALADDVAEKAMMYLGKALAAICTVTNPECILIGGGVSAAGEFLREKVERHFKAHAFAKIKETPVRLATLGNKAGSAGAAYMIISKTENI